jgi:hypothetical protein
MAGNSEGIVDIYGISMSYTPDMAKATKVLVTMPEDLLARIDRETENLGSTRSDFLQEAARRQLGWPDPAAIDDALERGRGALAGVGSFESAELVRSEREERDARDRRR